MNRLDKGGALGVGFQTHEHTRYSVDIGDPQTERMILFVIEQGMSREYR